jgi:colicin import membrane protein
VKREADKTRAEATARRQKEVEEWAEKIRVKIRSKANVPDSVTGNPEVQVRLRILPGGDVLEATITKSSGNRAYDAAIERAIRSAQPLPVPEPNSELFPQFRDLNLNIRHER